MWHCVATVCMNKEGREEERERETERDNVVSPDTHLDIHDCRLIKLSQQISHFNIH